MSDSIQVGDIVGRISHKSDLLFKVTGFIDDDGKQKVILKGLDVRLFADAPVEDLEKKSPSEISKIRHEYIKKNSDCMRQIFERRVEDKSRIRFRGQGKKNLMRADEPEHFEITGKVLHLDGDKDYLDLCRTTYSQLSIKVDGFHVSEEQQPELITEYLREYRPNILVLTGHDGLIKNGSDFKDINNYRNSKYFIEAVKKARLYETGRDDLIIFAGACQSHYEGILEAGANFASSPQRVLIHAFDPVFVVEKLAYTSIYDTITVQEIVESTITGLDGVGGIETRGCLRLGYPKSPY